MTRCVLYAAVLTLVMVLLAACSGGSISESPVIPGIMGMQGTCTGEDQKSTGSQTHLWGYFDVYIDLDTGEIFVDPNRSSMFTANVTNFLNVPGNFMKFTINSTPAGADYIDVDIDVHLTHPFPGLNKYNGYDVRGVFMGNGSGLMLYNPDLAYPVFGTDQFMFADPLSSGDDEGAPDGYTRWFNITEFGHPSMPLFGYTQGKLASPGFNGTARVCPYKYFADGLTVEDDLFTWLSENAVDHGVFKAGSTNIRNYYLRFPNATGVRYGYAVIADWQGDQPGDHPSNMPEAAACRVADESTVYYIDDTTNGGALDLTIDLWNWSPAEMANLQIFIESTVLSSVYELDSLEMTPIGGNENYSTFHVEVDADNVAGPDGHEYWIIAQSGLSDYTNEFGVTNDAWDDPLAAFFRYDLELAGSDEPVCDVVLDPDNPAMPYEGWATEFGFDATGSFDPMGGTLTYEWDFNDDGIFGDSYDSGTDDYPFKIYDFENHTKVGLRVTNDSSQSSECNVAVDIATFPSKNIPLRDDAKPWDVTIDSVSGRILILYDDVTVWQYLADEFYQQPNPDGLYYDTNWEEMDPWPGHTFYVSKGFLETMDSGYSVVNFSWNPGTWVDRAWYDVVDPDGDLVIRHSPHANWSVSYSTSDIMAWGETGTYPNDVGMIWGTSIPGSLNYVSTSVGVMGWPSEVYYSNHYGSGVLYGYQYLICIWVRGTEVDQDDDAFWAVETNDYYAARWQLGVTGFQNSQANGMLYDAAHFGTGSQTESDNGFYNPKDLTRDDQNRYMVLDALSDSSSRIKGWDIDPMPATSLGGLDLDPILNGPSIKFDGGDYSDPVYGCYIAVIHGDDTEGYFLSIFFPEDFPW